MIKQLKYIFNKKDKIIISLLLFAAILASMFELLGVTIFMPLIEIIMNPENIESTPILNKVYNSLGFQSSNDFLVFISISIIFVYILKNVYLLLEKNWMYIFSYHIQSSLSTRLLKAYMDEPYTFHLNKNTSVLQRSLQEDCDLFTKGIIHALELTVEVCVCSVLGVYLYTVSKSITTIVLVLLLVSILLFTNISRKFSKTLGKECQEYKGKLYQWMNQALGGIKEVKVLNREDYFLNSYEVYFKKYVHGLRMNRLIGTMPRYFVEAVCMSGILLAIIIKIKFGHGEINSYVSQLTVFAVAAFRMLPAVGKINEHVSNILYTKPSVDLIYHDLIDIEDVAEKTEGADLSWKFQNQIEIRNVCYHYPDVKEMVVNGANFTVRKGESVAFIGPSGAGKTTMVDLLLGLLQPQYGKIIADGMSIHKHLATWQKEIGYIPQVIYLSDDTIRNNIAFGIAEKEISEDAVIDALKKSQLFDFVDGLQDGLDTYVGDRGVRLSGGQRQRIGIARALYHNPELLVLDEATSALDSETESAVMESIDNLKGKKTMIIIAHRLTTIRNVDRIYEVCDGQVLPRSKKEALNDK